MILILILILIFNFDFDFVNVLFVFTCLFLLLLLTCLFKIGLCLHSLFLFLLDFAQNRILKSNSKFSKCVESSFAFFD